MIDFACKRFEIDEIIKCSLSLTRAELKIIKFFLKNTSGSFNSVEIKKKLGLQLSTVQKALKKLNSKRVLKRSQKNLKNGGYVYYYSLKPKNSVRIVLKEIISNWVERVEKEIDKL